jgi:hypothetical protein
MSIEVIGHEHANPLRLSAGPQHVLMVQAGTLLCDFRGDRDGPDVGVGPRLHRDSGDESSRHSRGCQR